MERIALTNESGRWFDVSSAEKYKEAVEWDCNNFISVATGSQWDHEILFRTKSGKWVLNCWSQRSGTLETFKEVDDSYAAKWLVRNKHDSEIVKDQIAELEL